MHKNKNPNIKTKGALNKHFKTKDNATTKLQKWKGIMAPLPSANPSMIQLGNLWEHQGNAQKQNPKTKLGHPTAPFWQIPEHDLIKIPPYMPNMAGS